MLALVIDDNANNLNVLASLLQKQGLETIAINHPRDVLDTLDELEKLSVVFLDLEMPQQSGFDLLDQIKAHPAASHTPIIAYTVHVSEITVAHEHGFDGFIGKPLDPAKFPGQLARILKGEGVWETA